VARSSGASPIPAAQETGLLPGTPVATGGPDQYLRGSGSRAVTSERILDSAGTAEAIMVTLDAPVYSR